LKLPALQTTGSEAPESTLTRLLGSFCALALCAAFYFADRYGIVGMFGGYVVLGMLAVTFAALPWLPPERRSLAVLALSLAVAGYVLRGLLLVPLAFTGLALHTVQRPWSKARKLGLLFGTWVAVAVVGWFAGRYFDHHIGLVVYWGSVPAMIIWIVLDHGRGRLEGVSNHEKWLYFLAFPRFCAPFVHPIGAARLVRSWQPRHSAWRSVRALGLALYAIAAFYVLAHTHFSAKSFTEPLSLMEHGPRIFRNAVHIYVYNCGAIFMAISLFRMAGYDLGSGFNWPGLSSSPSDFFRRWNYYFFEFASTVIFMPITARLRRWMPLRLAYIFAAYASFALGVWVLDIVGRFPQSYLGIATLKALTNPHDLRIHFFFWTMIIAAQLVIMPARRLNRHWWWRVVGNAYTWAVAIAGLVWLFVTKNRLY
jgi:hypothetical protein